VKNRKLLSLLVILFLSIVVTAQATMIPFANKNIASASITLSSSMVTTFSCSANAKYNISVKNVKLEVKNANGSWSFVKDLSAPPSATNVGNYNKVMDYSSSCTKGKTYRIKATFYAGTESVDRTSAEKKYQ